MSRLGGSKIKIPDPKPLDRIHVYQLSSMTEAAEKFRSAFELPQFNKRWNEREYAYPNIPGRMISGDKSQADRIMAKADALMEEAIIEDPRLTRRSAWSRQEEGIDGCPALIAAGEERAYFDRRKLRLADEATGEPVRIVISTDSNSIKPENASAFIAMAKLAQQFRPLEIWWQGAWLREETSKTVAERGFGHIFLVPLVNGDMDYSRLQFVLSDVQRDSASFYIMASHALRQSMGWGAGVAPQSFLPNTFAFVRESGIDPSPSQVAAWAGYLAGLPNRWGTNPSGDEAEQQWRQPQPPPVFTKADPAEQRRQRENEKRWEKERREQEAAQAASRMAAI